MERGQSEKVIYIQYVPDNMTFWERQNHGFSKKFSGC